MADKSLSDFMFLEIIPKKYSLCASNIEFCEHNSISSNFVKLVKSL